MFVLQGNVRKCACESPLHFNGLYSKKKSNTTQILLLLKYSFTMWFCKNAFLSVQPFIPLYFPFNFFFIFLMSHLNCWQKNWKKNRIELTEIAKPVPSLLNKSLICHNHSQHIDSCIHEGRTEKGAGTGIERNNCSVHYKILISWRWRKIWWIVWQKQSVLPGMCCCSRGRHCSALH